MNLLEAITPFHAAVAAAGLSALKTASSPSPMDDSALRTPHSALAEPHLAKYLIVEREGRQSALLFPATVQHSHMVPAQARVVSAGFYQIIDAQTLLVGGESMSLNVHSRPEIDRPLIQNLLPSPDSLIH